MMTDFSRAVFSNQKFQAVSSDYFKPSLMIVDFAWWMDNERDILNWMVDHMPRGIEHQQGMVLNFDTEQDRMLFLLRWG